MIVNACCRQLTESPPVDTALLSVLVSLANPVRLRIIYMLREREQCVCHLTGALGLTQGTISYHMGLLKDCGLVLDRRDEHDGRWTYYRLNPEAVAAFQSGLASLLDTASAGLAPAGCGDGENGASQSGKVEQNECS